MGERLESLLLGKLCWRGNQIVEMCEEKFSWLSISIIKQLFQDLRIDSIRRREKWCFRSTLKLIRSIIYASKEAEALVTWFQKVFPSTFVRYLRIKRNIDREINKCIRGERKTIWNVAIVYTKKLWSASKITDWTVRFKPFFSLSTLGKASHTFWQKRDRSMAWNTAMLHSTTASTFSRSLIARIFASETPIVHFAFYSTVSLKTKPTKRINVFSAFRCSTKKLRAPFPSSHHLSDSQEQINLCRLYISYRAILTDCRTLGLKTTRERAKAKKFMHREEIR